MCYAIYSVWRCLMRLKITKSAHSTSYQVIKSAFINGKRTSVTVESLGNSKDIIARTGCSDPEKWAREYVASLNDNARKDHVETTITLESSKSIPLDTSRSFNGGYLFLQQIYYKLGLDRISKAVKKKHSFEYNLNSILSRLLYTRIIFPGSKLSSFEDSKKFIEQPDFELQDIYRSLSVLASDSDYIQSCLYKNSLLISKRKTKIIYYDCTNFFFEIEESADDSLKQYGISKEHRPNPIVQMGLFMDEEGIPLAFCINPGNTNEQQTLKPLEKTLMEDFGVSKFVVCTDAGLSSLDNRKFNNEGDRAFVTTQSVKVMKKHLQEWALSHDEWHISGTDKIFNLDEIDESKHVDTLFYKERWINENNLEQHMIVTYSVKSKKYQRSIRDKQIDRAKLLIEKGGKELKHKRQTDYKRFIEIRTCTEDGEITAHEMYELNEDTIASEERFDGFYAVCTNLEGHTSDIIKINQRRWEIEDCFRLMKSEFKSRPVYLQRDDRIKAHFMLCFIALTIFRYLEKALDYKYSSHDITQCLKSMNFLKLEGHGYIPTYNRNELTDALHAAFGFDTSKEIVSITEMKKICSTMKKGN